MVASGRAWAAGAAGAGGAETAHDAETARDSATARDAGTAGPAHPYDDAACCSCCEVGCGCAASWSPAACCLCFTFRNHASRHPASVERSAPSSHLHKRGTRKGEQRRKGAGEMTSRLIRTGPQQGRGQSAEGSRASRAPKQQIYAARATRGQCYAGRFHSRGRAPGPLAAMQPEPRRCPARCP